MKRRALWGIAALALIGCFLACAGQQSAALPTEQPAARPTDTASPTAAPSDTPTPTATPTPTPTPTPEPTQEPITAERIDAGEFDSYFDDAVFIGDSMTKELGNYVLRQRNEAGACLGEAKFMGVVSMSLNIAHTNEPVFPYRGPCSLTNVILKTEAKKVFILLGTNDIGTRSWENVKADYVAVFDLIRENCPGTQIIVQSIGPGTLNFCRNRNLDIAHWNSFNTELMALCSEQGVDFLTFAEALMDADGYLRLEYANGDLHLSAEGNAIWVRALRVYAAQKMNPDAALAADMIAQ